MNKMKSVQSRNLSKEELLEELSLLTGSSSLNFDYQYYQVVKNGCYYDKIINQENSIQLVTEDVVVEDFESWFNSIGKENNNE